MTGTENVKYMKTLMSIKTNVFKKKLNYGLI